MRMIGIVDYGQGNINSVSKALDKLNVDYLVSGLIDELMICTHLILPGVGAFPAAMKKLDDLNLIEFLRKRSSDTPILGICLGAQLLFESSTEHGVTTGLGILRGEVISFNDCQVEKTMNVGWRKVFQEGMIRDAEYSDYIAEKEFYFVHKYFIRCYEEDAIKYVSSNANFKFVSAVEKDHTIACQFHPEKSRIQGLNLIQKFINFNGKQEHATKV